MSLRVSAARFSTPGRGAASRAPGRTGAAEALTTNVCPALALFRRPPARPPVRKVGAGRRLAGWRFVAQAYLRCLLYERAQPTRLYPLLAVAAVPLVACVLSNAAAGGEHTNVFVNCFCSERGGRRAVHDLKQKVGALSGYRLADQPFGVGVGVHLPCRDTGAEVKGAQSAVSVAYTVYRDSPNEVFVVSAVMLVGAHRVEPTTAAIGSTVRRIASENGSILRLPRSGGAHN